MSERLKQICIGTLLGDASIQKNSSKQVEKWRVKLLQGKKHREYVYHLHQEFAGYVRAAPFFNSTRNCYSFSTLFHQDFVPLARIFVNAEGKKHVSSYFSENPISPISLAYWFMDDGGLLSYNKDYPRRGVVLNTHGFSPDECQLLSENINQQYGLHSWCKDNKGKKIVAFSGKEWCLLYQIISPHIESSCRYKFPATPEGGR